MIDKDYLYNKIMELVAVTVKNILDETLTTYPYSKVQTYITKILNKFNISITEESDKFFIPKEIINDDNLTNKQLSVYSLISDTFSEQDILDIKHALSIIGYSYLKEFVDNKQYLLFTPNKQNSLNIDHPIFKQMKYFYHVCPHYVTEKIKKQGFVPKAKNKLFNYDPRIHFLYYGVPQNIINELLFNLDKHNISKGNNHCYDVILIKIPENITFYKDLDYNFGVYTKENIKPIYIENIVTVKNVNNLGNILNNLNGLIIR